MATVQSSHKIDNVQDFETIIIDECHNCSRQQYQDILMCDFKYRFGFSATPFHPNNKLKNYKIKSWLGEILYEKATVELINEGYLAKPIIVFYKIDKATKKTTLRNKEAIKEIDILEAKWKQAERDGIIRNVYRNKVIIALANNLPGTTLILFKSIDHGQFLCNNIPGSILLSGINDIKERTIAVQGLESGTIKIILASTIFDEGIDIKRINNVLLVSGGKSFTKTIQRIGRGARRYIDENGIEKTTVKVFDFYDETNVILHRHSDERIKFSESEGYKVSIKNIS
jgi:superfamily II DNA or RNA helicase